MKKTKVLSVLAAMSMILAATSFTACSGLEEDIATSQTKETKSTENAADSVVLSITLPGKTSERAVYTADDVASYSVNLALANSDYSVTASGAPGDELTLTLTKEGSYTVTVTGLDSDGDVIAEGSTTKELAFSKETQTVAITISGRTKEIDVSVTVAWSESQADSYVTGQSVTLDGTTYYVISNNISGISSSRSAEESDTTTESTGDDEIDTIIEKYASDVFVRRLLKEIGVTSYVELWNPNNEDAAYSGSESVYYGDKFIIVNEDGNKLAIFSQKWSSYDIVNYLISKGDTTYTSGLTTSSLNTEKAAAFQEIPVSVLRSTFDPNRFRVTTQSAFYGDDLTKCQSIEKVYNYDVNGEVALTKANVNHANWSKDYQTVGSSVKNSYVYKEFYTSSDYARTDYWLNRSTNGEFYGLQECDYYDSNQRTFKVNGRGSGELDGNILTDDRNLSVSLAFNKTESRALELSVILDEASEGDYKKYYLSTGALDTSKTLYEQEVTVYKQLEEGGTKTQLYADSSSETKYTLMGALTSLDLFTPYIRVNEAEYETVNGMAVPASIQLKAPFKSTADFKGEYLVVTLVPDTSVTDAISYKVANASETINGESVPTFVKAYSDTFTTAGSSDTAHSFAAYEPFSSTVDGVETTYTSKAECEANTRYVCPNCGTSYATEAERDDCDHQSGCPGYTVTCPICGTEYDTDEECAACAHQTGCPGYTVSHFSGENLTADTVGDFTDLTFESFPEDSIVVRSGESGSYTYTPVSTFEEFSDLFDADDSNSYSPMLAVGSYSVGGAVFYAGGSNPGKVKLSFKWVKDEDGNHTGSLDQVTKILLNGTSISGVESTDTMLDVADLQSYVKIHASGAGTVTASVKAPGSLTTDDATTSSAVVLFDKMGTVLLYQNLTGINSNEIKDISIDVTEEKDVYLAFIKGANETNNNFGSLTINGFEFEAAEAE